MPIGEIYGLAAQGLALGELSRPTEGRALSARAVELQKTTEQLEGLERVLAIHASVCEKAGNLEEARRAISEGYAEVERKASRLADRRLRDSYLAARIPRQIAAHYRRLFDLPE
jgi:hypothetical protein